MDNPAADVDVAALPVQLAELPDALPVTLPVNGPANPVAVNIPVLELNVKFVPDFGGNAPVAAVVNNTLQDVSVDSSATVTFVDVVDESALPDNAPVKVVAVTALVVIVDDPLSILPNPDVIEPVSNIPTVTILELPAIRDFPSSCD